MTTVNGHVPAAGPELVPFVLPRAGPAAEWPALVTAKAVTPPPEAERAARELSRNFRNYPWPLLVIAAPAAVAIWSGWVGLGEMCGFGPIHPLPGIADSFTIDTAITLPVGVEAYGAYALAVWLGAKKISAKTRGWARASAVGALALGCLGQIAFHLLSAARWVQAPWPVVTIVSCLPVVSLALAAALAHMVIADLRSDREAAPDDDEMTEPVAPVVGPDNDSDDDTQDDGEVDTDVPPDLPPPLDDDTEPPLPPPPDPPRNRQPRTSGRVKAAAILKRNPGLSDAVVAKRAGVSERTVQRARSELASDG